MTDGEGLAITSEQGRSSAAQDSDLRDEQDDREIFYDVLIGDVAASSPRVAL